MTLHPAFDTPEWKPSEERRRAAECKARSMFPRETSLPNYMSLPKN